MPHKKIKILGIIPARGGSKGIPHKNIAHLNGKPLIYYSIREAKKSKLLDAFIVSTDDPKIADVAKKYGADVPFLRPKKIAGDRSPDIEFLQHAVEWVEKNRDWHPEIVVFLQPTAPSRTANDIDEALKMMLKNKCDSVRTVADPSPHNPFKMWLFTDKKRGLMKPLLLNAYYPKLGTDVPRQLLPEYFLQVGLVYATKTKFIKQGKVWGPKICGLIIPPERLVDIDAPKDLKHAARVLKRLGL